MTSPIGREVQYCSLNCATSPPISRINGLQAESGHRPRHRVAPRDSTRPIDNTLYDAFGQRQVSTIFTQLNQYHVVLEVEPDFQQNPDALKNIYVKSGPGTQVPLQRVHSF